METREVIYGVTGSRPALMGKALSADCATVFGVTADAEVAPAPAHVELSVVSSWGGVLDGNLNTAENIVPRSEREPAGLAT